jgi:hypothetical protein
MRREIEITVRIGSELIGMSVLGVIAWHPDIEVLATHLYRDHDGFKLLLVTTNPQKVFHILGAAGFRCNTNPVVLVGPLRNLELGSLIGAELAASGIQILYSYASRVGVDHQYLILKTADDERAIQTLEVNSVYGKTQSNSWSEQAAVSQIESNWQQAAA